MGRLKKQILQHFKKNPFQVPRCYYCAVQLTRDRTKWPRLKTHFTIDHFIPQWTRANDSIFGIGNIKICCNECNGVRGTVGDPCVPVVKKVEMIEKYLEIKGSVHLDFYKYLFIYLPGHTKDMTITI